MTSEQANERIQQIGRLWPGAAQRMTVEEAESWRRVMLPHSPQDCDTALRYLRDTLTVWPTPGHLHARLRGTARPSSAYRPPAGGMTYREWIERHGRPAHLTG
jgi:hypothetical protein